MAELFPKLKGLALRVGATTWFACIAFSLGLMGCDSGQWSETEFKAAQLQFSVPSGWNIEVRPSGGPAMGPKGLGADFPDGAVLTALPFLEDAALVIVATQKPIEPQWFAEKADEYIPLDEINFTRKAEPYRNNGVSGFEGEGHGKTPTTGIPVYFRSLTVAVNGRAVMITLYAESARKEAFVTVFEQVLGSVTPVDGASFTTDTKTPAAKQTPGAAVVPPPAETTDAGAGAEPVTDANTSTKEEAPAKLDAEAEQALEEKPPENTEAIAPTLEVEEPKTAVPPRPMEEKPENAGSKESSTTPKTAEAKEPNDTDAPKKKPAAAKPEPAPAKVDAAGGSTEPSDPPKPAAAKGPAEAQEKPTVPETAPTSAPAAP